MAIPKRGGGRKPLLALKELNVGDCIDLGSYSKELQQKYSGVLYYFNQTNKPMKVVSRKVKYNLFVYREM